MWWCSLGGGLDLDTNPGSEKAVRKKSRKESRANDLDVKYQKTQKSGEEGKLKESIT